MEQLRATWAQQADESGHVDRTSFAQGLAAIGITDPLVVEQNFSMFDRDRNGAIDFREFVAGLSVLQRGSSDEKLKLLFDAYDLDSNGSLDRDEVFAIYKASLSFGKDTQFGSAREETDAINKLVDQCFAFADDVYAARAGTRRCALTTRARAHRTTTARCSLTSLKKRSKRRRWCSTR